MGSAENKRRRRDRLYSANRKAVALTGAFSAVTENLSVVLQILFGVTLFTSASLLFVVQPMAAKMLLPLLGGAPSVWTTCMVFFQTALLGGYLYAHLSSTYLTLARQTLLHATLLLVSAFCVPLGVSQHWTIFASMPPVVSVLGVLALSVGIPFFTLSASAPLLQNWFSKTGDGSAENPYFLYSASNLGSLVVLIAYPTVLEPWLGLLWQTQTWSLGFGILAALVATCTTLLRVSRESHGLGMYDELKPATVQEGDESEVQEPPRATEKIRWIGYALVPSSLMLGVTTYFTMDIATIPLLWIAPLALYLASFIVVFSRWNQDIQNLFNAATAIAVIALLFVVFVKPEMSVVTTLIVHLTTFFLVTMAMHGQLSLSRPSAAHLTHFYLWMSFGGMLGGVLNAIVAPLIFKTSLEYNLVLALSSALLSFGQSGPIFGKRWLGIAADVAYGALVAAATYWLIAHWTDSRFGLETLRQYFGTNFHRAVTYIIYGVPAALALIAAGYQRAIAFRGAVLAFGLISLLVPRYDTNVIFRDRSFFGVLKVTDDSAWGVRYLTNGTTLHGEQWLDPNYRHQPLTYYHRQGPVGQIFAAFQNEAPRPLAFIGLGTGSLASYGRPGQDVTFFEIDEAVVRIARRYFSYLDDCAGNLNIVMGDARLKLQESPDNHYGLIFVDAFSSDSIPVHLLTKEAVALYFRKLATDGIVAVHISNRYLDLEPIVGRLAMELDLKAYVMNDSKDDSVGKTASTWVVLARSKAHLRDLPSRHFFPLDGFSWTRPWTDDYTSLYDILR